MIITLPARAYAALTAEERFRLMLAAGARGDTAEQVRLAQAGQLLALDVRDDIPALCAFRELALLTFIELLDLVGVYRDTMMRDPPGTRTEDPVSESDEPADTGLELTLAAGCLLREKARGWQRFCADLGVPPHALWEGLPGFDRLIRSLTLAETLAYSRAGLRRWLARTRPGESDPSGPVIAAARLARAYHRIYRDRVVRWGGDRPPDHVEAAKS